MQARAFGSFARRQAPPSVFGKILRDLPGSPANQLLLAPRAEHVVGGDAQDIALACLAQGGLDVAGDRSRCGQCAGVF